LEAKLRAAATQTDALKRAKDKLEMSARDLTSQVEALKRDKDKLQREGAAQLNLAGQEKSRADGLQTALDKLRGEALAGRQQLERHARVHQALGAARAGNPARAVAEVEELYQGKALDAAGCMALARVYCLAAAGGSTGADKRGLYADRAVDLLRAARDRG